MKYPELENVVFFDPENGDTQELLINVMGDGRLPDSDYELFQNLLVKFVNDKTGTKLSRKEKSDC